MYQRLFYRNHYLMHSRFELFIPELESGNLIALFKKSVDQIEKLESVLSRFIEDSTTSLLNKLAAIEPIKVDDYYFEIIERCIDYHQRTYGYFNISHRSFPTPDLNIKLNAEDKSIFFETPGISFDFGALGKGLAIEIAIQIIKENNIDDALINFGDSSVYAIGSHPQGEYWPVKIVNGNSSQTFQLKNNGLSSSGLHVNDDKSVAHIIDPITGKLINKNEKVVVISNNPVLAEVLSTAIYAADNHIRDKIKKEFKEAEVFVL